MTSKILFVAGALLAGVIPAAAADNAAPQPATPAAAAAPTVSPLQAQLQTLVTKIKAKLQAGQNTEAALAPELKEFDALLAAHRNEKTEEVGEVAFMRAMLYVQVFQDYDKGSELLQQLKADYPGTKVAEAADRVLPELQAQKQAMALQAQLKPGSVFPDFHAKDLAGHPLSVSQYRGKVVLVDFWATWCPPCRAEMPNVVAAYQKYHDKGFEIVGISLDQKEDQLKQYLAANNMTWPQYFDGLGWNSKLGTKYGVNSIPANFLLDANGRIVAKDLRGPALGAQLEKMLGKSS